ncbi:cellulase family glycosylhydrolase [Ulvibacterium sp.]|uniref:glycoside hydrolase family 5 protein n=1 Tax=Ulvibacterium sp. TaxID=2665914 RepID=UPI002620AC8D|nr:cellulase family glycosylhydrolase [Ulvibacterium sp.]
MKHKLFYICLLIGIVAFQACNTKSKKEMEIDESPVGKYHWKTYRGVNVNCTIQEEDIKYLAESGGNLVRLSMPICTFIELKEPYTLNESAFIKLDSVLNWGEKYGVNVLIDPHKYPGTEHQWTMLGSDPFWKDFKWHNVIIYFWEKLAERYAQRGSVVAGYDLLNEPQIPLDMEKGTPEDVNLLYKKLTDAIRRVDTLHTIVYALPRIYDEPNKKMYGYHKGIQKFDLPSDDNICLETHTYMPKAFSHQNIWEEGDYVPYPVTLEGVVWDKGKLEEEQFELIQFSIDNPDIPILVGEFSSPRWTGQDGIRYLSDIIDIAEEQNWSWAYHAYRENQVWDPEMSITNRADSVRIENAPRWELLKNYFSRNHK